MTATADPRPDLEPEEELPRMSFGDHLDELRKRLIRALGAVFVAILLMLPFKEAVQEVIITPYRTLWFRAYGEFIERLEEKEAAGTLSENPEAGFLGFYRENRDEVFAGEYEYPHLIESRGGFTMPYELVAINGLDDFWMFMMASFVFAIMLASPVVLWQAWAFIAAGLYQRERKVVYRYFPFALGLLVAGVGFGYFVVVPNGLYWLVRLMNPGQVTPMLTVSNYFSLLFMLTAALGVVFQLPMVMLALQKVGIVTHAAFRRHWRGIILGIWVIAALVTPPDPITQLLMAAPLLVLYALGLMLSWRSEKKAAAVAGGPPERGA